MNTIVELNQLLTQKQFTVPEDIKVEAEGYIGKITINLEGPKQIDETMN